jgi:hypothetical protein
VPGRHVRAAGERLDVQRTGVLAVDPVADAAQEREVAQPLRRGGPGWHLRIVPCASTHATRRVEAGMRGPQEPTTTTPSVR